MEDQYASESAQILKVRKKLQVRLKEMENSTTPQALNRAFVTLLRQRKGEQSQEESKKKRDFSKLQVVESVSKKVQAVIARVEDSIFS